MHSHRAEESAKRYRGRIAPSPTGLLHAGHARTFWTAFERAKAGDLVLRIEDLDHHRCRPEFIDAILRDLRWLGMDWQEGPDCGGKFGPYVQSQREAIYQSAFVRLQEGGFLYPCVCSRREVALTLSAPHAGHEEPIYPGSCRDRRIESLPAGRKTNWRFRVPDGESIEFIDGNFGPQRFIAGRDFGDFVVWSHDAIPSYQLAVVADDAAMQITEVVRGADLLLSTARQILLFRSLGFTEPRFYHCPLVVDAEGHRLAKRDDSRSLQQFRESGSSPADVRATFF